jgi:hypothetical protein
MTDERLQHLMTEAAPTYRVPADSPLDEMWGRIEAEHFDGAGRADRGVLRLVESLRWRQWGRAVTGIAATLIVGIGIGRFTASDSTSDLPAATAAAEQELNGATESLPRATSRVLDDAALLLASLPTDGRRLDERFTGQVTQTLTTTRLLLDSPEVTDARLRLLLEDLELVLVQIARLNATGRAEEITFITAAMDERDVVPRLRTVAAAMSYNDF